MKTVITWILALGASAVVGAVIMMEFGCGKPNASAVPQVIEIRSGSNVVAQLAEPIEARAMVHLADSYKPVDSVIRIMPGTWLAPEQLFNVQGGELVACNGKYCEVK